MHRGNDADSVREAAADLDKARAKNKVPRAEDEPIDRGYRYYAGEKAGEPVEPEQTLDAERAARDLRMVREYEAASQQPHDLNQLAAAVDGVRQAYPGQRELPPDFVEQLQQAHAEQAQQQSQPETPSELNDQARAHMAAEEPQQPGIDPEIQQALANPKVRAALEAEVQAAESARVQYASATRTAAQLSAASLLASYPELANVPTNQLQTAISVISARDPQRGQAITAHLQRTQQLYDASIQAQNAQQQIQAQKVDAWVKSEEAKFDREVFSKETVETRQKLQAALPEIIEKDFGIPLADFAFALKNTPTLRSSAFQKVLLSAAKWELARKDMAEKKFTPLPPVHRPGVSQPRGADSGVEAAMRAFRQNPGPQTGAALLQARRAATRR